MNDFRLDKLTEVRILWEIADCPNCIRIFSAWEQSGFLHILFEYCENGRYFHSHLLSFSLREALDFMIGQDLHLTDDQIANILIQICLVHTNI